MKVKRTYITKDILYIGLVEGKDYKAIGISPYTVAGFDSSLDEQIKVTVINQVIEIDNILYDNIIALDKNNNIVYTELSKF